MPDLEEDSPLDLEELLARMPEAGGRESDLTSQYLEEEGCGADVAELLGEEGFMPTDDRCRTHPERYSRGLVLRDAAAAAAFFQLPEAVLEDEELADRLRSIYSELLDVTGNPEKYLEGGDRTPEEWDAWEADLRSQLLGKDGFKAHSLRWHLPAWAAFMATDPGRGPSKALLKRLEEGYKFDFVSPLDECQEEHPRYKTNMAMLRRTLQKGYGPERAESFLEGTSPQPIHLPNHGSLSQHKEFVDAQVETLVSTGAAMEWHFEEGPPKVVLPLGVVVNGAGKERLVLDGRYTNAYSKYQRFKYEQLADLTTYLEQGDYGYSTDATSGFHHMSLAPECWEYAAFFYEGKYYVYTVPAFGLAPVPRWYTEMMKEVYLRVRDAGVRMTFMIDDQAGWAKGLGPAAAQSRAVALLLAVLGFYLNLIKSRFRPALLVEFLGLEVDSEGMVFRVPGPKLGRFDVDAKGVLANPKLNMRDVARIAGKLLSFTLAVGMAPVLTRGLYHAMAGQTSWAELFDFPEALREVMEWCVDAVSKYNGTRMIKRLASLIVVGDASETGVGVFLPNRELEGVIVKDYNTEQLRLMDAQDKKMSSTYREVMAMRIGIEVLAEQAAHLVKGRRVQYRCDSQAATAAVNRMAGNPRVFEEVRRLWVLCKDLDCELEVVWYRRSEPDQQEADRLSKLTDNSQWLLNADVFLSLETKLWELTGTADAQGRRRGGRRLTIDLFADDECTKVEGKFFSRWYCPGTAGVNSFSQRWDRYWDAVQGWRRHMGFCNGPFDFMPEILHKVIEERADVVLIYPRWPKGWRQALDRIEAMGALLLDERLEHRNDLFMAGPRVPKKKGKPTAKAPHYAVHCAYIVWPKELWLKD